VPRRDNAGAALNRPGSVTVLAEAATAAGGMFFRDAVVQRTRDPAQPFQILEWRQRRRAPSAAAASEPNSNR
jgi:hypothetical protein